jgi:hypothetical protein
VASLKNPGYYDSSNNKNDGVGTNSFYNIVDYKGVIISDVIPTGSGGLWIQPAAVMPDGATLVDPLGVPTGEEDYTDRTVFLPAKLSLMGN